MKLLRKIKYPLTVFIVILILTGIIITKKKLSNKKFELTEEANLLVEKDNKDVSSTEEKSDKEPNQKCYVDIKGAIKKPGVYFTNCNSNVNDIIVLAGGLNENANTSVINLAKKITDEMVIIIYTNDEVQNSNVVDTVIKYVDKECNCPNIKNDGCINNEIDKNITNKSDKDDNDIVNINTASLTELQTLSGIGKSKAEAIIRYREQNGNFKSIEDLLNVDGIGEKLYEEIKPNITV